MTAYHRPTDLTQALALLAGGNLCVAAGCTDLFPATTAKSLPGDVLDITAIAGLRGVTPVDGGWRIGAATTWSDLIAADLPPAFNGLKLAAREVGSVQIQNAGTIAGNLCTASPSGDGVPCLLTLDASVELCSSRGSRVLPLAEFLTGARRTARLADEMVSAILVPGYAGMGMGHFLKLGARKYLIIAIAMVAARLETDGELICRAAIAVGACSAVATRLPELEAALSGQRLAGCAELVTNELVGPRLSPIDDIRADQAYRRMAATELVRRALADLSHPERAAT
ncbi:MAG: FAD binding domain-containing protein [Rhodobacter sp.]|nr:FAD binding domain-containing protein [Rhodobacter sp.]